MKKINIIATCMLGMATLSLTSCGDVADEITSIIYGRNFSPTDFEYSSVKEDGVTLKWNASSGATSYTIEVFQDDSLTFEGTPVKTIEGITGTSVTLTDLVYDTKYSARIKALTEGDESKTSKWNDLFFRTNAQQIFENANEEDIADRSINLRWPAGEVVTKLVAYDKDGNVVSTKDLTAEEIAAGKATYGGLTPETQYTIRLYNGEKQRGSKTFTTIADLNGATLVRTTDDLKQIIENAPDGAVLALYGGTHVIDNSNGSTGGMAQIQHNITIKGIYPTNVPVIKGRFEIYGGASVTINQVKFDGSENEGNGDQLFNYKDAGVTYGALTVQNASIKGYKKGVVYLASGVTSTVSKVTFKGCTITECAVDGGDLFDCRGGLISEFNLTESTVYNCAQSRDFIRLDDSSANVSGSCTVNVTNCTIDNVLNKASNKRMLYVRYAGNVLTWKNNIVTNTKAVFSNQSKTSQPTFEGNVYYNAAGLQKTDEVNKVTIADFDGATQDPKYTDAANGDFTVGNNTVVKLGAGDPRWIK